MTGAAALIGAAPIAGPVEAAGVPVGPPALLERDAPLGAVCDALQAAGSGEGGALPMEAGLAYGLIGQAVVALDGYGVDELDRLASPWDRSGRLYRIFRLIAQAAAQTPLLLALDDLHWSDPDSLELLAYLCRRLAGSRTLVLGTLRAEPDPASRMAEELVGSGHARVVAESLSEPLQARWPHVAVGLGHAGLAVADGRLDETDAQFARALAAFDEMPLPIAHAETLVSYGRHLRQTGRPRQARAPLHQALGLPKRAGAERVARLARAELAATGGRRRRGGEDRSALTAQEQRVAQLAAQGMSNVQIAAALIVSAKTIDNHLQQVYAKNRAFSSCYGQGAWPGCTARRDPATNGIRGPTAEMVHAAREGEELGDS
jgi:DNA-binding CsgD family transcriptional regulator